MKRKLPQREADGIRRAGLDLTDRHLQLRVLARLDLRKVKKVFEEGDVYQIGKRKYRAVLQLGGKTAFVIFERRFDSNVLKTVGITRSRRGRWD